MLFVSASVIVVLIWIFIPLENVSNRPPETFTEDSASQGVKLDFYVSENEVSLQPGVYFSAKMERERFWKGIEKKGTTLSLTSC